MPDVAVIVVNYNGGSLLKRCLDSVLAQSPPPAEILVVDNASVDASVDALPAGVDVIRSTRNEGFAAAVQAGLGATSAPFVFLLNPDVRMLPGCLAAAGAALDSDLELGAVAPRVLQAADPARIDATGIGLTSYFGQINCDHGLRAEDLGSEPVEVLGPLGGASLWRRSALDRAGGFCSAYFLYWEDMDLALRMNRAGYACRTVPSACLEHEGSATVGKWSATNVFYMVRNHWPCLLSAAPGHLLARRPLAFGLAPVRAAWLYARRGRALAALWGLVCGAFLLPAAWRRRRGLPRSGKGAKAARRIADLMAAADANRITMRSQAARVDWRSAP